MVFAPIKADIELKEWLPTKDWRISLLLLFCCFSMAELSFSASLKPKTADPSKIAKEKIRVLFRYFIICFYF
jgi:hypothetical protein